MQGPPVLPAPGRDTPGRPPRPHPAPGPGASTPWLPPSAPPRVGGFLLSAPRRVCEGSSRARAGRIWGFPGAGPDPSRAPGTTADEATPEGAGDGLHPGAPSGETAFGGRPWPTSRDRPRPPCSRGAETAARAGGTRRGRARGGRGPPASRRVESFQEQASRTSDVISVEGFLPTLAGGVRFHGPDSMQGSIPSSFVGLQGRRQELVDCPA